MDARLRVVDITPSMADVVSGAVPKPQTIDPDVPNTYRRAMEAVERDIERVSLEPPSLEWEFEIYGHEEPPDGFEWTVYAPDWRRRVYVVHLNDDGTRAAWFRTEIDEAVLSRCNHVLWRRRDYTVEQWRLMGGYCALALSLCEHCSDSALDGRTESLENTSLMPSGVEG